MSEPEDLLGRADALLKRYHPSSPGAQAEVPVLTEVVANPPPVAPQAAPTQNAPTKAELLELEQRLKQNILDSIGSHVAKIIEEPLKVRLDAHLHRALAGLSAQLKTDLEVLIREAVARAVEAEIARTRGPRGG
jgi:hypothetical protein